MTLQQKQRDKLCQQKKKLKKASFQSEEVCSVCSASTKKNSIWFTHISKYCYNYDTRVYEP